MNNNRQKIEIVIVRSFLAKLDDPFCPFLYGFPPWMFEKAPVDDGICKGWFVSGRIESCFALRLRNMCNDQGYLVLKL